MGIAIVRRMTESMFDFLMEGADESSPLRRVMPHVAKAQLERAYTIKEEEIKDGTILAFTMHAVRFEAEGEIVRRYVTEDFCGLCGRYTDHLGEH